MNDHEKRCLFITQQYFKGNITGYQYIAEITNIVAEIQANLENAK